jgi:hypothetical protein
MSIVKLVNVYPVKADSTPDYSQGPLGRERQTTYAGKVLRIFNEDYRAMSDVYTYASFAVVWEGGKEIKVMVNANFECDDSCGHATVDATPAVLLEVEVVRAQAAIVENSRVSLLREKAAEDARKRPEIGRIVKVVRGRKVPLLTTGLVFWQGTQYGELKIGISPSGVKVGNKYTDAIWIAAKNVEAIG